MRVKLLFFSVICILGTSCGGGSGGGDTSPNSIDTGDRTEVKVETSEIHGNGISLKIRFPEGLVYVSDSSLLTIGKDEIDIGPTVNKSDGEDIYLVYYLDFDDFDDDAMGTFTMQLEGEAEVLDGRIEVDPDVDDPNIPNDREFDIENPEFRAESDTFIEVLE